MNNLSALMLAALLVGTTATAQTSVGVSVGINQPGVYGRIEIGNVPPPPLVYARPIVITPAVVAVRQEPVYLYVPPGHQKHWAKHCAQYSACGQPVYFVQERWIRERYESQDPDKRRGHKDKSDKKSKKGHGDD